jgi:hypothetical protein
VNVKINEAVNIGVAYCITTPGNYAFRFVNTREFNICKIHGDEFRTRIYQSRPLLLHVSTVIIYTAAAKVEVMDVSHILLINAKIMSYQSFFIHQLMNK